MYRTITKLLLIFENFWIDMVQHPLLWAGLPHSCLRPAPRIYCRPVPSNVVVHIVSQHLVSTNSTRSGISGPKQSKVPPWIYRLSQILSQLNPSYSPRLCGSVSHLQGCHWPMLDQREYHIHSASTEEPNFNRRRKRYKASPSSFGFLISLRFNTI